MVNTDLAPRRGKWSKRGLALGVILAVIVIALIGWVIHREQTLGPAAQVDTVNHFDLTPQKFETSVRGSIICLKIKAGTPPNTATTSHANNIDCVRGLKGDDGRIYALNTTAIGAPEISMPEGKRVTAVGNYQPANNKVDEGNVFIYDGVLVVRAMSTN